MICFEPDFRNLSEFEADGDVPLANPLTYAQCHFSVRDKPSKVMFLKLIPSKDGTALGSQASSGWSLDPRLNLIGILTLSIVMLFTVTLAMYPPLPISVLILTPDAQSHTCKSSMVTFETPPDISLPIPTPEQLPNHRRSLCSSLRCTHLCTSLEITGK